MNNTFSLKMINNYLSYIYIIKYNFLKCINRIIRLTNYIKLSNKKNILCILMLLLSIIYIKINETFAMDKNSKDNASEKTSEFKEPLPITSGSEEDYKFKRLEELEKIYKEEQQLQEKILKDIRKREKKGQNISLSLKNKHHELIQRQLRLQQYIRNERRIKEIISTGKKELGLQSGIIMQPKGEKPSLKGASASSSQQPIPTSSPSLSLPQPSTSPTRASVSPKGPFLQQKEFQHAKENEPERLSTLPPFLEKPDQVFIMAKDSAGVSTEKFVEAVQEAGQILPKWVHLFLDEQTKLYFSMKTIETWERTQVKKHFNLPFSASVMTKITVEHPKLPDKVSFFSFENVERKEIHKVLSKDKALEASSTSGEGGEVRSSKEVLSLLPERPKIALNTPTTCVGDEFFCMECNRDENYEEKSLEELSKICKVERLMQETILKEIKERHRSGENTSVLENKYHSLVERQVKMQKHMEARKLLQELSVLSVQSHTRSESKREKPLEKPVISSMQTSDSSLSQSSPNSAKPSVYTEEPGIQQKESQDAKPPCLPLVAEGIKKLSLNAIRRLYADGEQVKEIMSKQVKLERKERKVSQKTLNLYLTVVEQQRQLRELVQEKEKEEKEKVEKLHSEEKDVGRDPKNKKQKEVTKKLQQLSLTEQKTKAPSTSSLSVITTSSESPTQESTQMLLESRLSPEGEEQPQQPSSTTHHAPNPKKKHKQKIESVTKQPLSTTPVSNAPSIEPKAQQPSATIPQKRKEKKKHLDNTKEPLSSTSQVKPTQQPPSTDGVSPSDPLQPVKLDFEPLEIPDTPKKKKKKKKKPGFGILVGNSLFSDNTTESPDTTTSSEPVQTQSKITTQDYKDEKEALKNCPLSPPEDFSDDDNNTENSEQKYIPGVFTGNNLNIHNPESKKSPPYQPNIIDLSIALPEDLDSLNMYTEEDNDVPTQQESKGKVEKPQKTGEEADVLDLSSQNVTQSTTAEQVEEPTPPSGDDRRNRSRRQRQGRTQTKIMKKPPSSSSLLENFNPEGQLSSLQGMQHALVDASEQISATLKTLALKAHTSTWHLSLYLNEKKQLHSSLNKNLMSFKKDKSNIEYTQILDALYSVQPYSVFASTNSYTTNLESKVRSGQAGLMVNAFPEINIGLAYDCNKKEYKEYKGLQLNSNVGSVKSKTTTDGLATIVTLNPDKKGFTGNMVGFYSWGKVKNTRNVIQGEREITTKGSPDITLSGGLVQIGYNLSTIKSLLLTPYVEYLISMVRWSPYNEDHTSTPCRIDENRENVLENSIGLKSKWELTKHSQLQTWIVGSSGLKKTNSLSLSSMLTPVFKYNISTPGYKKRYTKTEVGLSYESQLTPSLTVGLDGMLCFEKIEKVENKQQIFFHFNYYY